MSNIVKNINNINPKLPNDFDYITYIELNNDLKGMSDLEATNHYINHGRFEKRVYKYDLSELNNINHLDNLVYIIGNPRQGGGTTKYCQDLIQNYSYHTKFMYIDYKRKLDLITLKKSDILFIMHLLNTDINITDILNKDKNECNIIIAIHDFYWLTDNLNVFSEKVHNCYLQLNLSINQHVINLFSKSNCIIHTGLFTFNVYKKYIDSTYFKTIKHNDYVIDNMCQYIPLIENNTINLGHLAESTMCKGINFIELLMNKYKIYNKYNINYYLINKNIPPYKECEFYDYVVKYNLHGLFYLNNWGETWCYTLTKGLNSGLPIIYNNFGSFKERIINKEHYFKVFEDESEKNNIDILYASFEKMLDYIILNNGKFNNTSKNNIIKYNSFYDNLFGKTIHNNIYDFTTIHNKIKPFAVYFPQFHEIIENNKNYYEGFTDIKNLELLLKTNIGVDSDIPNTELYKLNKLDDYNLTDINIINKQILVAKQYGIYGFAMYYYWFSKNTITNQNMIMEKVINNFFINNLSIKIFFIWANENWSDNPAFGENNQNIIKNVYDDDNFIKNIENLLVYFKHDNYYKIENKPVFSIHHPWFIDDDKLDRFYILLDNMCKQHNFSGVHLIINNMAKDYNNYTNYLFHPNYKKQFPNIVTYNQINSRIEIDYKKYFESVQINKNIIQSCFFDFDNRARLIKPDKISKATVCINNNTLTQIISLEKVIDVYKIDNKDEINKIFLINAWNEWGENMSVEPGDRLKYKYLDIIKNRLLTFY